MKKGKELSQLEQKAEQLNQKVHILEEAIASIDDAIDLLEQLNDHKAIALLKTVVNRKKEKGYEKNS